MNNDGGAPGLNNYISAEAAACRLGYKPQTRAKWRSQGYGPAFRKDRRKISYRVGTLDAWATANDGYSNTAQVIFERMEVAPKQSGSLASGVTVGARAASNALQ